MTRLTLLLVTVCLRSACWAFLCPSHHSATSRLQPPLHSAQQLYMLPPTSTPGSLAVSPRVQRLKDVSFQKEILKDITAAEFALQVEIKNAESTIDYDRLILKLENKLSLLQTRGDSSDNQALRDRLLGTQKDLIRLKDMGPPSKTTSARYGPPAPAPAPTTPPSSEGDRLKEIQESLRVIVREDGTVDWDGAKATGKEVAKFGAELWERLNGKEESEGLPSIAEIFGQVQAKAPETDDVIRLRAAVDAAKEDIERVLKTRDELRRDLRVARRDGLEIQPADVKVLKKLDARVKDLDNRLRISTLDLDIERICVYLQKELESSLEPLDQRVFIAEAALLDKQLASIVAGLRLGAGAGASAPADSDAAAEAAGPGARKAAASYLPAGISSLLEEKEDRKLTDLTLVDEDELALVIGEVGDLKSRLGLDAVAQMDWGSLGVLVSDSIAKVKVGLNFYGEGTKLLISDVQYAGALLAKAVSGAILKPREVNTVRRTGKDLLTLIPFTIILIIPLSPVGHVLVFSFIQRFFPGGCSVLAGAFWLLFSSF